MVLNHIMLAGIEWKYVRLASWEEIALHIRFTIWYLNKTL